MPARVAHPDVLWFPLRVRPDEGGGPEGPGHARARNVIRSIHTVRCRSGPGTFRRLFLKKSGGALHMGGRARGAGRLGLPLRDDALRGRAGERERQRHAGRQEQRHQQAGLRHAPPAPLLRRRAGRQGVTRTRGPLPGALMTCAGHPSAAPGHRHQQAGPRHAPPAPLLRRRAAVAGRAARRNPGSEGARAGSPGAPRRSSSSLTPLAQFAPRCSMPNTSKTLAQPWGTPCGTPPRAPGAA